MEEEPQTALLSTPVTQPNQRQAMDYVSDRLSSGRTIRTLTIIDVYTRECPALEVVRAYQAWAYGAVCTTAQQLLRSDEIQVDNGSEFVSRAV